MWSPEEMGMPVFTTYDAVNQIGRGRDAVFGILKREVAAKGLIRIRRGLYALPANRGCTVDALMLSQRIYGPSYISLEYALSWHDLIPEAAYTITAVCQGKSKHFTTPLGAFSFQRVPQKILYSGVRQVETQGGASFLIASPLKALCDLFYCSRKHWTGLEDALSDLRIERADLPRPEAQELEELLDNYRNSRILTFLSRLKEEYS